MTFNSCKSRHVLLWLVIAWSVLSLSFCETSDAVDHDDDFDNDKSRKTAKMFNFASQTAGAVVLDKSPPSAKGYSNLLNDDKDKYGISPCSENKWIVIGLSEDVLITSVAIANYERYSSMLKEFRLYAANSYPSDQWIDLGSYTAEARLGEQLFNVTNHAAAHTRYLKIKFKSHYESDALCTLSQIKVHGMTVIASFKQEVEWSDSERRDMLHQLSNEVVVEQIEEVLGIAGGEAPEHITVGNGTDDNHTESAVDSKVDITVATEGASASSPIITNTNNTNNTTESAGVASQSDSHNNTDSAIVNEEDVQNVTLVGDMNAATNAMNQADVTTTSPSQAVLESALAQPAAVYSNNSVADVLLHEGDAVDSEKVILTETIVPETVSLAPTTPQPDESHFVLDANVAAIAVSNDINIISSSNINNTSEIYSAITTSNSTSNTTTTSMENTSSLSLGSQVDGLLGLVLRQVGDLLLWTNVTEAIDISEVTDDENDGEAYSVVSNATHLASTEESTPLTSSAVFEKSDSLVDLPVVTDSVSLSAAVGEVSAEAISNSTQAPIETQSDAAQLLPSSVDANATCQEPGVVVGTLDNSSSSENSLGSSQLVEIAHSPVVLFEEPDYRQFGTDTHFESTRNNALLNETTPSVEVIVPSATDASSSSETVACNTNAVDDHVVISNSLPDDRNTDEPSPANSTTSVGSDESSVSSVAGMASGGSGLLPSFQGTNTSSPMTAVLLNCFETMRLSDFKAKMTAKLNRSREMLEDSPLLGGNNNVFRLLMARIKALELENAIMDMYVLQLTDCYRAVTKDMQQSLVAINESRIESEKREVVSLELAPRISPPINETTTSSESGSSLYSLAAQWLRAIPVYMQRGADDEAVRLAWSQADVYLHSHLLEVMLVMAVFCLSSLILMSLLLFIMMLKGRTKKLRRLSR